MAENVRLFDEVIKHAGSKTVLYMTWARRHSPEAQKAITDAYAAIGRELGAIVVPVGLAWQQFLAKRDKPVLHNRDDSHPTLAGSLDIKQTGLQHSGDDSRTEGAGDRHRNS
jgi:hypothetical protein